MKRQIPKVIHYCWFGRNEKPEIVRKCISSWKKYCPDYELIEWNEDNYDISKNKYMEDAYKNKKWAFVSDYARLDIIYENGGIYLDSDVELKKNLDRFRKNKAFIGFHTPDQVNTGCILGAVPMFELIRELRDGYNLRRFTKQDGSLNLETCNAYESRFFQSKGLKLNNTMQVVEGMKVYPTEYFAPKEPLSGICRLTPKTVSIHHYNASWYPKEKIGKRNRDRKIYSIFGETAGNKMIQILDKICIKDKKELLRDISPRNVKLIAFYLPQYHEIPENNQWWGKGFTEWVNVKKANPIFIGHQQPRIPLNNNYYDLADIKVMERQMKLAAQKGIDGFCFYHYWFCGKKMLEKPVEQILKNKNAKLPFCLAWANEPWTKTWHGPGGEKEVLIRQQYGEEKDWDKHYNYLSTFFKDNRYIKIENKPVLLIYRINEMKNYHQMFKRWDILAKEQGFSGVFIVSMTAWRENQAKSKYILGKTDFVPGKWLRNQDNSYLRNMRKKLYEKFPNFNFWNYFMCNHYSYDKVNQQFLKQKHLKNEFRCVFVDFDDSPRRGKNATIFRGSSPQKFEKYLRENMIKCRQEQNEFLFINAWNEWGEGNYLEPDKRYGYAYLNAVKRAKQAKQGKR